jgi:signal peptidase I
MRRSIAGTTLPSVMTQRRAPRPWLAALLSLLQAGLGHVYAGNVAKGIAIGVGALVAAIVVLFATVELPGAGTLVLVLLLAIVVYVAIPIDAWREAARIRASNRERHPELWTAMLVFFVVYALIGTANRTWMRRRIIEPFRVPSMAMAPTLRAGDWIYTVPRRGAPLHVGEVVVYRGEGSQLTKRIVALGGDTIAMEKARLIRNGRAVVEPFMMLEDTIDRADSDFVWESRSLANPATRASYHPTLDNWGPLVVPARNVFVLGDNRHNSRDSRYTGFVPVDSVTKVPTEIYFSWDPDTRSVRWNRIGRTIQ